MRYALLGPVMILVAQLSLAQMQPEELYKSVLPSVMTIVVEKKDGSVGLGTAFMTRKDGLAVTAWHVVMDAKRVVAKFSDGEEFEVSGLVDNDQRRDLGLLRVKVAGRPILRLVSEAPEVGSKAYVIGAPKGLEFTVSDGLVSQIQTVGGMKQYQFSCPASPGNSGGPLLNSKGEVIGVVSWQVREGQNLSFAIPATYVLGLDPTLPTQPWENVKPSGGLGAGLVPIDKMDRLLAESIVTINDAVTAANYTWHEVVRKNWGLRSGVPFFLYRSQRELSSVISGLSESVSVVPERDRPRNQILETAKSVKESVDLLIEAVRLAQAAGGWSAEANDLLSKSSGAYRDTVDYRSDEFVKLKESKVFRESLPPGLYDLMMSEHAFRLGVYFFSQDPLALAVVPKGTFAYDLGLRTGDKVIRAGGTDLKSVIEFKNAIKDSVGKTLRVSVIREGKPRELTITIPRELPKN